MPKRSRIELERREMLFFKGDWARLDEILRPRKISPTQFIRELVHKKIRQIDDRASQNHNSLETIDVNTDGLSTEPSLTDLP
ncbi:MAG TPA: hypothetical protein VM260_13335 [Pirellula sp.]|nr:hypothetical protein [Pirellula sp.]